MSLSISGTRPHPPFLSFLSSPLLPHKADSRSLSLPHTRSLTPSPTHWVACMTTALQRLGHHRQVHTIRHKHYTYSHSCIFKRVLYESHYVERSYLYDIACGLWRAPVKQLLSWLVPCPSPCPSPCFALALALTYSPALVIPRSHDT